MASKHGAAEKFPSDKQIKKRKIAEEDNDEDSSFCSDESESLPSASSEETSDQDNQVKTPFYAARPLVSPLALLHTYRKFVFLYAPNEKVSL